MNITIKITQKVRITANPGRDAKYFIESHNGVRKRRAEIPAHNVYGDSRYKYPCLVPCDSGPSPSFERAKSIDSSLPSRSTKIEATDGFSRMLDVLPKQDGDRLRKISLYLSEEEKQKIFETESIRLISNIDIALRTYFHKDNP